MTFELLTGLMLFALASSISPGPNNLMLMASGATFGLRRTMPHLLGVGFGFMIMVILVGLGISELFVRYGWAQLALQVLSVLYLGYLAFSMVRSSSTAAQPERHSKFVARPLSLGQAMLFPWVNPKSWAMALTALSVYAPNPGWWSIVLVAIVFGVINLPSGSVWAILGQTLSGWLTEPRRMQAFNTAMATLLLASLLPLVGLI